MHQRINTNINISIRQYKCITTSSYHNDYVVESMRTSGPRVLAHARRTTHIPPAL